MSQPDPNVREGGINPLSDALQGKKMELESGVLGKFFGAPENAPLNIAGLVALLMVIASVGFTIWPPKDFQAMEFWKQTTVPILTLILGYIIGKSHKD
jgi:hypothetical protein